MSRWGFDRCAGKKMLVRKVERRLSSSGEEVGVKTGRAPGLNRK